MANYGVTVPLGGLLAEQGPALRELVDLGYTEIWSSEADGADAFTPLAVASVHAPELRLGTAIVPAFTRGPALMAQSVASMASAAPGRFVLGIGSSSNVIVERWNDIAFVEPYKRTRDMIGFLRTALTGEKVVEQYDTFSVNGFRLGVRPPAEPVPILVAALREGMLRLAGREGDGAIVNWLSADDVRRVAGIVHEEGPGKEIVARLFVCPSEDAETVRAAAKRSIAAYVNVPVYRKFHEWLGRTDVLGEHWSRWDAGDRAGSLAVMPDSVVDELFIHGSAADCRAHIERYFANGVTSISLSVMPFAGVDPAQALRDLSPR